MIIVPKLSSFNRFHTANRQKYQRKTVRFQHFDAFYSSRIYGDILSSAEYIQIAWHCSSCLHQIDDFFFGCRWYLFFIDSIFPHSIFHSPLFVQFLFHHWRKQVPIRRNIVHKIIPINTDVYLAKQWHTINIKIELDNLWLHSNLQLSENMRQHSK